MLARPTENWELLMRISGIDDHSEYCVPKTSENNCARKSLSLFSLILCMYTLSIAFLATSFKVLYLSGHAFEA